VVWAGLLVDRLRQIFATDQPPVQKTTTNTYTLPPARDYRERSFYLINGTGGSVTVSVLPGDTLVGNSNLSTDGIFASDGDTWHRFS